MRASPLKVLPMPISACAAIPRDLEGDDADGNCAAAVTVVIAENAGNTVSDDDDEEDERNDEC